MNNILVYIISDLNGLFYCGITNNIERRLNEHNSKKKGWTKKGLNWKVVYQESWPSRLAARKREILIKNFGPKKFFMKFGKCL